MSSALDKRAIRSDILEERSRHWRRMGEPSSSFLTSIRRKLNRRSHSSPPDAGSQRSLPQWADIPLGYQPVPTYNPLPPPAQYATRKTSGHRPKPLPSAPEQYARYDPSAYQAPVKPQHRHTTPRQQSRQAVNIPPPPLLQLPKPRAMWRRSLEDLSPSKRENGWDVPTIHPKRASSWDPYSANTDRSSAREDEPDIAIQMTVDLACALPPQYFDQPPGYDSVQQAAKENRSSNSWADWSVQQEQQQQRLQEQERQYWASATCRSDLPRITTTAPPKEQVQHYSQSQHAYHQYPPHAQYHYHPSTYPANDTAAGHDVTIDNLL